MFKFTTKKNGMEETDQMERMNELDKKIDSLSNAINAMADYLQSRDNEDDKTLEVKPKEIDNEEGITLDELNAKIDTLTDIVEKLVGIEERENEEKELEALKNEEDEMGNEYDEMENENDENNIENGEGITDEEKDALRKEIIEKSNAKKRGFFNQLNTAKKNASVHDTAPVSMNTLSSRIDRGNARYGKK